VRLVIQPRDQSIRATVVPLDLDAIPGARRDAQVAAGCEGGATVALAELKRRVAAARTVAAVDDSLIARGSRPGVADDQSSEVGAVVDLDPRAIGDPVGSGDRFGVVV